MSMTRSPRIDLAIVTLLLGAATHIARGQSEPVVIGTDVAGSGLGASLALSGDTVATIGGLAVYVFVRDGDGRWNYETTILDPNVLDNANNAHAIALDGDTLAFATASYQKIDADSGLDIFERAGGAWALAASFPNEFSFSTYFQSEGLAAGSGSVIARGRPFGNWGAVLEKPGGVWQIVATLPSAGDTYYPVEYVRTADEICTLAPFAYSDGKYVSLQVFRSIAGAWEVEPNAPPLPLDFYMYWPHAFDGARIALRAELYVSTIDTRHTSATFVRDSNDVWKFFGELWCGEDEVYWSDFAFSDNRLFAGCAYCDVDGIVDAGAVFVFEQSESASGWVLRGQLLAPNPAPGDLFGFALAGQDGLLVVGAPGADVAGNTSHGLAYAFDAVDVDCTPPRFLSVPTATPAAAGGTATLASPAFAPAGAELMYRWRRDGILLFDTEKYSGTGSPTLQVHFVQDADELNVFDVIALADDCSEISESARVTACATIVAQPLAPPAQCEHNAFQVALAVAETNVGYQWQRDGVSLVDDDRIHGATTSVLDVADSRESDSGSYACLIRRHVPTCEELSAAATVRVLAAPTLATEPTDTTVATGGTAAFFAQTDQPTLPYLFQWLLGGAPLADGPNVFGSAGPVLIISPATYLDAGEYSCAVSHYELPCITTSRAARLTVTGCPIPLEACARSDIAPLLAPDCAVNLDDLGALLASYAPGVPGKSRADGDIAPPPTGDGFVDLADLGQMLSDFGSDCR